MTNGWRRVHGLRSAFGGGAAKKDGRRSRQLSQVPVTVGKLPQIPCEVEYQGGAGRGRQENRSVDDPAAPAPVDADGRRCAYSRKPLYSVLS